MASLGVGGCRVCAGRFVCGVCYWVLDGIRDRTGGWVDLQETTP